MPNIPTGPVTPGSNGSGRSTAAMTPLELREIFKRMVREEMYVGTLTYSRRDQLLRYAKQIGLGPIQANILIYEARQETDIEPLDAPESMTPKRSELGLIRWLVWVQLGLVIAAVAYLHSLLRRIF